MAVDTTQSWQEHTSDGSTAYFPFNFNYDTTRPGTIVVGKRTADNTYSVVDASNYELIPNAAGDGGQIRFIQNPSGSQIIDDIPPAGTIVRIERVSVDTSSATWQIGLEMSELVNLFDRLFRLVQENKGGFDNVIKTFETQHNVSLYELLSAHNNHLLYWDNTTQTLTPTDFPKEDIVRATNGMFLRISTDTAGNPYLEWSLTGTDNWHSVSDTAVEALSKINNHLADKNNPHETAISKLTDVELTNLSANQFLSFDGIKWKNVYSSATVSWGTILGDITDQTDLINMFVQKAGDTMSGALNIEDIASSNAPLLTLTHSNTATYKWNIAPRYNSTTLSIYPGSTETNGFRFATTGFVPASNNARYLGSASLKWKGVYTAMLNNGGDLVVPAVSGTIATKADVDLAANSGRMITDQGVWYAKMYAATVAPSAEDGTNYADFSQTDGQGNPIIVIYERQNGAWVQDQTITPPADYDGYVSITSKIWDIVEQAGQQGGRILWNHQSKEFTPYPQIISFEDAALTGTPTAPTLNASSPSDQIVNKQTLENALANHGTGRNVGDIFLTMRNDNELNGAVECDGSTYNTTDFTGAQSIGQLLADGKVPYVSMATYASTVATQGWCDKFGWDGAGNIQFKVPTLSAYIWQKLQTSVVGNGSQIGLQDASNNDRTLIGWNSGANYPFAGNANYTTGNIGDSASGTLKVSTDATKSGIIAGSASDISQQRCMVQLATSATDEALETCTSVLADVADLKDHRVIAFQAPTAQNNYTWYRKYADGWVEQGGIVLDSEAGNYTVNLPVAMADTNYDIQLTCKQDANGCFAYYMNQTTTSFVREATNGGGTTAGRETKWRVEGIAAS